MPRDTDRYDFFVSYARADNSTNWITGFVDGILAEHKAFSGGRELTYFFDKSEIRGGHDWQHRIHHAVAESRVFLAFISPNYFASEWCRREWRAWIDTEIAKHVFSDGAAPVYIVEVPGFEHDDPLIRQLLRRQFLSVHSFYDEGLEALRREDLRRVLAGLAKDLDDRAERVRHAAESANTVPPYNKNFSGRVDELLTLRERLKSDRAGVVCGLHGLGGIGKTELAFAFAHAFAGVYPGGRLLVPCDGKATIREAALSLGDFSDFRAAISDEERKTPGSLFAAVYSCLARRLDEKGNILLVLDNVTNQALMTEAETDELTKLGPRFHLLMTTRLAPPPGGNWLTLGELPEVDAMDLLEKHHPFADASEREAAQRIVKRLGGFAIAVELVAAFLAAHGGATYEMLANRIGLEDLETIAADPTVELRRHNHERRLTAVLEPVLASLDDVERRTMEIAAFLPPDTVALPWLRELVEAEVPHAFEPAGLIADPWAEVCSRLTRSALFSRSSIEESWRVRVHRLVQELVRRGMLPERLMECRQAVDTLVRTRDAGLEKTTRWDSSRWELEPLDALANLWAENNHEDASWLLNQAGLRWHVVAEWARAEPLMRRALAIDEASHGKDHPLVALRLNSLALLLQAMNRLREAEPLMWRALGIDEAISGTDHPDVARDLNNLALLLQATNRLREAEPLMWRALAIDEASYGKDHPDVATCLNNLADLLQATNRLSEAEPLMRRALAIDEASYGKDHPSVAVDLSNLATLLHVTNRLSEAEPLMRRGLAIDEERYGKDHPLVATRLNNLAQLLQATNRLSEAEPLMRRVLVIDEESYGKDHPDVATDLNNLAQLLKATNRLREAEPLVRRALEIFLIFTRETHHEHPGLQTLVLNYTKLLQAMKLSETEVLDKLSSLGPEPLAILFEELNKRR